jgi:hypothetical protein
LIIVIAISLLAACNGDGTGGNSNNNNNGGGGSNNKKDTQNFDKKAASYAEAYNQQFAILDVMGKTLDKINDKHNENLEYGDEEYTGLIFFGILFVSLDLAFTASLSEASDALTTLKAAYSFWQIDAEINKPRANEYNISYTNQDGERVVEECKFDPSTGSLSFVTKKDGKISNFYEFVNLGGDKYAFQNNSSRAIVTYKSGVVSDFIYSSYDVYNWGGEGGDEPYDHAKESIYPNGIGVNANWVFADGVDSYKNAYKYDGSSLRIDTNPNYGSGTHITIPAN